MHRSRGIIDWDCIMAARINTRTSKIPRAGVSGACGLASPTQTHGGECLIVTGFYLRAICV